MGRGATRTLSLPPGGEAALRRLAAEAAPREACGLLLGSGLEVDDIILQQLASSYAVLTEDEKELGVCLCDIGGGTTDIAVFVHGAIHHSAVIPIAGDQRPLYEALREFIAGRVKTLESDAAKKEAK